MRAISGRAAKEDPKNSEDWSGRVRPLSDRVIPKSARASAGAMFGAVGFVLLIACANVASLQLARGMMRRKEFALRASLGAGRASLIRLQVAESLLLSVAGGCVAVLAAYWTVPMLKRVAPPEMQIFELARVDLATLAFALALSLLTGVVFGVTPAWLLTRGNLAEGLQDAGRGSTGGRYSILKGLVVVEMTLALVLVSGGTMMIRSLIRQQTADPGFDKADLTARAHPPACRPVSGIVPGGRFLFARTREPAARQWRGSRGAGADSAFGRRQQLRHGSRGGRVRSAAGIHGRRYDSQPGLLPGHANSADRRPRIQQPGSRQSGRRGHRQRILRPPLLARRPTAAGEAGASGRRESGMAHGVVGVTRDVRHVSISDPPRPEVYRPHSQVSERTMMLVARSRTAGQGTAAAIRSAVWQVDREQPLFRLQSVEAFLLGRNPGAGATTKVLGGLALIALLLAAIGTYSVMAYTAAQRRREIGIRIALGASAQSVFAMVSKSGLALAGIGSLAGLPAAYGITPLLRMATDGLQANETRSTPAWQSCCLWWRSRRALLPR